MPPRTDHKDAIIAKLIQLCFFERTIGASNTSVGIGKNIDSMKLRTLR